MDKDMHKNSSDPGKKELGCYMYLMGYGPTMMVNLFTNLH